MDTTTRRRLTGVPLLLAATLSLTACAAGSDADSSAPSATSAKDAPVVERGAVGGGGDAAMFDSAVSADLAYGAGNSTTSTAGQSASEAEAPADYVQSIISTGMVSLLGDDVAQARFDVQKIVDAHGGEIAEEKTQTDEDGAISRSRLVVRIPVAQFDEAMEELEGTARLESSSRSSEDVTTEVIDTQVRIRAQSESLQRVEVLLARARTIRDIVAIESQLTRRQAELDSLKARQAYLSDQTSLSTITVFLQETPAKKAKVEPKKDESGFLAGLSSGWDGMKHFLIGAATVVGAVLPFGILLVVLGVPLWLLARSRRVRRWISRSRSGRTPSAA